MKWIPLMLLLLACGKHDMPSEKALGDADGDQIQDEYESSEFNRYVADVTPIRQIKAQIKFQQGILAIEKSVIDLENNLDLTKYSLDLMVTKSTLPVEDYFSEFSVLKIQGDSKVIKLKQDKIPLKFIIKSPKEFIQLTLFQNNLAKESWIIKDSLDIEVLQSDLENILSGKAHFALSSLETKKFYQITQSENIKQKTYRVVVNNGLETKVFYVSKDYALDKFLGSLSITDAKIIHHEHLMTTQYSTSKPEWWVNHLPTGDKVIVKHDLKTLADHYLSFFSYKKVSMARSNGSSSQVHQVTKEKKQLGLIKIRPSKANNIFNEYQSSETYHHGRASEGDKWNCLNSYRNLSTTKNIEVTEDDLRNVLIFSADNIELSDYDLISGSDEIGIFWEIVIPKDIQNLNFRIRSVNPNTIVRLGIYSSVCQNAYKETPLGQHMAAKEAWFKLEFETFLEKI